MESDVYGLLALAFVFLVYFLPTLWAAIRYSKRTSGIFVLNLFLGWTFLGWVIALAWAGSSDALG